MKTIYTILILLATMVAGSATTNTFGIYLTDGPIDPRILTYGKGDWKQAKLAESPLLMESDIVSYDFTNHVMTLQPEAMQRLPQPAVEGTPFVVVANGERIYLGVFMTSNSSFSRAVPSIVSDDSLLDCVPSTRVRISRSYPGHLPSEAPDPRSDERIKRALEQKIKRF